MQKIMTLLLCLFTNILFAQTTQPKLIVQLVVDQLRGDLIHQYQSEFGPSGFNYLLAHGLDFQNAQHPHANTVTCVGHATIATGSYPALHGIIANNWFNRDTQQDVYCVEDLKSHILATSRTTKELPGRSPINLAASTLSDEIVLAQKGRSFGVSLKDRSAITLAGHTGKAFWFDKENGGFITSHYYYTSYPEWVNKWNSGYQSNNESWVLSQPLERYRYKNSPTFKHRFPTFGAGFPHQTGNSNDELYYKYLSMMPNADELTADFAMQLLTNEKLGKTPNKTDYLSISFSVVDAVGHQFGPNSLESEDTLMRLDKTLASVLKTIDKEVGLKNTLIVLTADHGVTDSPSYLKSHHISKSPVVDIPRIRKKLVSALARQFNLPATTLQAIELPYLYLDHELINQNNQYTIRQVADSLAEKLRQQPGIFQAYSLPLSGVEPSWLSAKVNNMAFPNRAGDVYIVPPPYQSPADQAIRVDHGTPWAYDSYVPLLFVNPAFHARHISRPVSTTDIAPTLAALLQIKPPSASVGTPLKEVMGYYEGPSSQ